MRRLAILLPLTLLLALPAAPILAGEVERDQWYAVYIGENKSGHLHERVEKAEEDGRPVWISTSEMQFSLKRLGQALRMVQRSTVVEDAAGKILRFESIQSQGTMEQKTAGTLKDGRIHVAQMGTTRTVDYPEGALGPVAASRVAEKAGLEPGTKTVLSAFMAESPKLVVTQTTTVGPLEKKDVLGRVLMLHRVEIANSLIPIVARTWVDAEWVALVVEMDIPGLGTMRVLATEEQVALAESEPSEVFVATLVWPDRPIANPRALERAVYRLGRKDGALEDLYEGEGQSILSREGGKLDVEILAAEPGADFRAATLPFPSEGVERYLEPSAYIESDDETVVKLAREAVGDEKDAWKAAIRIQEFVEKKIAKKNLNVGFASAGEVARTLEGDCTEHGVLCAALARAVGLPSRVVTGLVYVPAGTETKGVFGFHMWTEVLIAKDRWFAIDAAIGDYDATHIAVAKSALSGLNPLIEMVLDILPVIGRLTIEVVEPE